MDLVKMVRTCCPVCVPASGMLGSRHYLWIQYDISLDLIEHATYRSPDNITTESRYIHLVQITVQ